MLKPTRAVLAGEAEIVSPPAARTRLVDRTTAEREALRFATTPLPTEQQLTEICRAARPT